MISNSQGTNYDSSSSDDDDDDDDDNDILFLASLSHKNFFQVIQMNLLRSFFPKIVSMASDYLKTSTGIWREVIFSALPCFQNHI